MKLTLVHTILIGVFCYWGLWLASNPAYALSMAQEINIIDQTYTTTATGSALPTDNGLGLIKWESGQYPDAKVYFEVSLRCNDCNDGNRQAKAALYTSGGTIVNNSTITIASDSYAIGRSNEITTNLSDGTLYSVRITADTDTGTASIMAARLVILQSADPLTTTQTAVEIGNNTTTTSQSYEIMPGPKLIKYDQIYYNPTPTVYFEASLKAAGSNNVAYAALSNASDCSNPIANSQISTLSTAWILVRSAAITLNTGSTYYVCIRSSDSQTSSIANAKLIFNQTSTNGIESTLLYHNLVNTLSESNATNYFSTFAQTYHEYVNYDGPYFTYYYEATVKATGGDSYTRLYNVSLGSPVTDSDFHTSSTAYTRIRSKKISVPTGVKIYESQWYNSAAIVSVSSANLLIYVHRYPQLSFGLEAVPGNTETNGVTTTTSSQTDRLDFGHLTPGTPVYLAHKLTLSTNAVDGYSVSIKLKDTLQGNYPANIIEEFPGAWSSPQAWTEPTGTTPNVSTGWIGANTSDTRISGWENGSAKFAGVGTINRKVMESAGVDPGTSVYVTYVLEVNQYQPTDLYAGTLTYSVLPTY